MDTATQAVEPRRQYHTRRMPPAKGASTRRAHQSVATPAVVAADEAAEGLLASWRRDATSAPASPNRRAAIRDVAQRNARARLPFTPDDARERASLRIEVAHHRSLPLAALMMIFALWRPFRGSPHERVRLQCR